MTTLSLDLDTETKRFERMDGPGRVHAGETVRLVLHGLPSEIVANPNGIDTVLDESDSDDAFNYPPLRARLVHPMYGDLAAYPWPGVPTAWVGDTAAGTVRCDICLDTEQLFRVVRSGFADGLKLYVERPWPQEAPTVYGTYALRVDDWPEVSGEVRSYPAGLRYLTALGALESLGALPESATLADVRTYVNQLVAALKTYRRSTNG